MEPMPAGRVAYALPVPAPKAQPEANGPSSFPASWGRFSLALRMAQTLLLIGDWGFHWPRFDTGRRWDNVF